MKDFANELGVGAADVGILQQVNIASYIQGVGFTLIIPIQFPPSSECECSLNFLVGLSVS